jgi:hypothetical protein
MNWFVFVIMGVIFFCNKVKKTTKDGGTIQLRKNKERLDLDGNEMD